MGACGAKDADGFAIKGHKGWVSGVAWSIDGTRLFTASKDKTAKIWTAKGKHERTLFHKMFVNCVATLPDGKYIVTGGGQGWLWDVRTGVNVLAFATCGLRSVAVSEDGERVMSGHWDNFARIWDTRTGKEMGSFEGHTKHVHGVALSHNYGLSASEDYTAKLWDVRANSNVRTFEGHTDYVHEVCFVGESLVASASADRTVKLWELDSGRCVATLNHPHTVTTMKSIRNHSQLLTGCYDDILRLWDVRSTTCVHEYDGHHDTVCAVDVSPDATKAITGSWDNSARVWTLPIAQEQKDSNPAILPTPEKQEQAGNEQQQKPHHTAKDVQKLKKAEEAEQAEINAIAAHQKEPKEPKEPSKEPSKEPPKEQSKAE